MKDIILNNWNFVRVLRLLIGLAIIVQAIVAADLLFGFLGLIFTAMALFNAACCGVGACASPAPKSKSASKEISYEEVV